MKLVGIELYCPECDKELRFDDADKANGIEVCPKCKRRMGRSYFVTCECGTTVYLCDPLTNECPTCGKLYNAFGEELAPRSEWGWCDDFYGGDY